MALQMTSLDQNDYASLPASTMVVELYDEAIGALRAAMEAIHRDDIEARCNNVSAATEIIGTLYLCLDFEKGGEIAENLGRIYSFLITRMARINFYNDLDTAQDAIDLLMPLRNSWFELDEMAQRAGTKMRGRKSAEVVALPL